MESTSFGKGEPDGGKEEKEEDDGIKDKREESRKRNKYYVGSMLVVRMVLREREK